jgi:hypothetical protein
MHKTLRVISIPYALPLSLPIWGDLEGWSRDPMFEKYPSISPYTYCANNPIILIDPNGEDWFQNELSGEVYFNSKIGKDGAGTGNMEGDGWKWMGDNNMMGTVDNEFVLKYQSLAHEGGGTAGVFNVGNENGYHDGYEMNFGSNSEKFMNEMGFEKRMSEAYVHITTTEWSYAEADLGRSTWSHSSENYENVKYAYVKQGLNQSYTVKREYEKSYKTGDAVFGTFHTFEIRSYQYNNNKQQGNIMNNSTFQYFIQKAANIIKHAYEAKH